MFRGTTPSLQFSIPYKVEQISYGYITFRQRDKIVLQKHTNDDGVFISDQMIRIHLTQQQTLQFEDNRVVECQIRMVLQDGNVTCSDIIRFTIGQIIKDGVI